MDTKASRTRSPNFPAINLAEAIVRIRQIFPSQRQYPANRETLVKLMGYKSLNGASAKVISALSKYGLLEGHGEALRVSDIGQDLALHEVGDPEYSRALNEAATQPSFFRELQSLYPQGLPSDHALRATLIKRGFHENAIGGAVRTFQETMELLEQAESAVDGRPESSLTRRQIESEPIGGESPSLEVSGPRSVALPLSSSVWAELSGPFPVSKPEWDQMIAVLSAMEPALVTRESAAAKHDQEPPDA